MAKYKINIKNSAKTDLKKIKRSHLQEQFLKIVEILKYNPYQQSQSFEKLHPKHLGRYSRRINHQHRVVYTIDEENKEVLNDISGLADANMELITHLIIQNNDLLSECDIQSICNYLETTIGNIEINNNASGCNSPKEVEDACSFFVPDHADNNAILLYPNPATNELFIVCNNGIQLTEVNIYNQLGQKVLQVYGNTQQLDVSMLSKGLYVAELITDKSKIRRKLLLE